MKPTIRLLILGAVLGALACFASTLINCATTAKVTAPVVSVVKDCADKATHAVALGILGDVSTILVCNATSGESLPACVTTQLEAIAKTSGWAAVLCALDEIQQKAGANVAASSDSTEYLRARRATAALARYGSPDGGAIIAP